MKKYLPFFSLMALLGTAGYSQLVAPPGMPGEPIVTDIGPHHRTWTRVTLETAPEGSGALPAGATFYRTNSYTEIETCMNFWSDGRWQPSEELIELFPPAGAIARRGACQVIFAANANTYGAIDLYQTLDGKRFRSHFLGLAYKSGNDSVMIAEIKDCVGELVGRNQILFPDALDGEVSAMLLYTCTKAGLMQDVILLNNPPPPSAWGLPDDSSTLMAITEFVEAPAPVKQPVVLPREAGAPPGEPAAVDEILSWGVMSMGAGAAFPADHADGLRINTFKSWNVLDDGRRVLAEETRYRVIRPFLERLPQAAVNSSRKKARLAKGPAPGNPGLAAVLPKAPPRRVQAGAPMRQQARLRLPERGFTIDYLQLASAANFTFSGDSTFYVSGNVYLSGTTVIEAGVVIKHTNSTTANKIEFQGPVETRANPYRPIISTSKDDNTVGEIINGSTGAPSGTYGNPAFALNAAGVTFDLHDLRFRYANQAIYLAGGTLKLSHSQIGYGAYGIQSASPAATVRNVLMHDLTSAAFYHPAGGNRHVENLTAHRLYALNSGLGVTYLTNSLLISVTNGTAHSGVGVFSSLDDTGIFGPVVGSGARYLAPGSPHRNAGTTNIDTALLAAIRRRTTYPPLLLTNTVAVNTTLRPQAKRDTEPLPALGYHYDALDYLMSGISVTNATLLITNGVAIAVNFSQTYHGISLLQGGKLISEGQPANWNHFVRTHAVQEIPNNNAAGWYPVLTGGGEAYFRFTDSAMVSGGHAHFYGGTAMASLAYRDCQLRGGIFSHNGNIAISGRQVALTNCLLEGLSYFGIGNGTDPINGYLYNNLFRGGGVYLHPLFATSWRILDNVFEGTIVTNYSSAYGAVVNYNAYLPGATRLVPFGANDLVTNIVFETGAGGYFFYPANSPLIDRGSRYATNAGLYHFCTTTNFVKEGTSLVDLGFHAVAISGSGLASDIDGDGLADVGEDANGNGSFDAGAGESDWTAYTSTYGIGSGPGLILFTPLK